MAIVKIEGQEIPLDDAIATNDANLRAALGPWYPELANANITRESKDGQMVVTVVKKAGSKGLGTPLHYLIAAPERLNPALELLWRLKRIEQERSDPLAFVEKLEMQGEIWATIERANGEEAATERALEKLRAASPVPSRIVPVGF